MPQMKENLEPLETFDNQEVREEIEVLWSEPKVDEHLDQMVVNQSAPTDAIETPTPKKSKPVVYIPKKKISSENKLNENSSEPRRSKRMANEMKKRRLWLL